MVLIGEVVPLFSDAGQVGLERSPVGSQPAQVGMVGAISLVFNVERLALINVDGYASLAMRHAIDVAARLAELGAAAPTEAPAPT